VFALLLLLALSITVEHVRGRCMLHHRLNQLKAKGEILSSAALRPKPLSQQDNAALDLLSLSNRLGTVMSNLDNTPPTLRFSSPGQAVVVWQMEHWCLDGKTTNDWNQVGVELNKSADLLEQLKGVTEKPGYDTEFDYQTGFVDFKMAPVGPVRNAARLLSVAVMDELARGQLDAANGHLCVLIRLAALQKPEPLLIYQDGAGFEPGIFPTDQALPGEVGICCRSARAGG